MIAALSADYLRKVDECSAKYFTDNADSGQTLQPEPKSESIADLKSRTNNSHIAQSLSEESGIHWDPISKLFEVMVGGAIVGAKVTWDAANGLYQQVLKSTQDHGGGKNDQHGKAEDRPSDIRRLQELEEQSKNAQGKEKKEIKKKIDRLRKDMADRRKGENHSRRAKR